MSAALCREMAEIAGRIRAQREEMVIAWHAAHPEPVAVPRDRASVLADIRTVQASIDPSSEMSDDHRLYTAGVEALARLRALNAELAKIDREAACAR